MKKISSAKLEAMYERIMSNPHKREGWFPTMEEAEELAADFLNNFEFIIWICESNPDEELTEEQQEVEQYLQNLLRENTKITEK